MIVLSSPSPIPCTLSPRSRITSAPLVGARLRSPKKYFTISPAHDPPITRRYSRSHLTVVIPAPALVFDYSRDCRERIVSGRLDGSMSGVITQRLRGESMIRDADGNREQSCIAAGAERQKNKTEIVE